MKRIYTHFFIYFLGFCMILILFSACGSSSSQRSREGDSTGSIIFNLSWGSNPVLRLRALSPSGNACVDYGIQDIEATMYNDSNTVIAAEICTCIDDQKTIENLPEGSGYSLSVEGLISDKVLWRGKITGISIIAGQITNAGTVDIDYIGDDIIPPYIEALNPSKGATDVPIDIKIEVQFNENIVEALLNTNTFILEGDGNTVSVSITYDPVSRKATFKPENPLSYFTTYTATIKREVQDQNSIEMSGDFSWSFTTEMGFLIWDAGNWDQAKWDY